MNLPGQRDDPFHKALKRSALAHGLIVITFILGPLFLQLFRREKPVEQITFIDLVQPPELTPPEPEPEPEEEQPAPEPPKPEIPEIPKKQEVKKPEPPKTNQVAKIKISTNKVKRASITPPKQKSPLSAEEIRKLLAAGLPQGGASRGQASEMSWYYALVRATMYEAWNQPGGLSGQGLQTMVNIRVARDGTITRRSLMKSSGNSLMDDSVMKALNSVSKLKALPLETGSSYKDITINFVPDE